MNTQEIFRECLLSYDQSQQMSRHVSLPENHDLIYHLPCGLVLLMPDFLFFLTLHVPEIFLVFVWDCGLSVKRSSS